MFYTSRSTCLPYWGGLWQRRCYANLDMHVQICITVTESINKHARIDALVHMTWTCDHVQISEVGILHHHSPWPRPPFILSLPSTSRPTAPTPGCARMANKHWPPSSLLYKPLTAVDATSAPEPLPSLMDVDQCFSEIPMQPWTIYLYIYIYA